MDLERFVDAQADTYDKALAELRAGRKTSHWMWWIFPQVAGLGRSGTSAAYAVADLDEATGSSVRASSPAAAPCSPSRTSAPSRCWGRSTR